MHALVRRRAFSQLNPVVFRKLSTYGPKATSVLVSTPKNHPYHENIRSSCAPPFSSTAPPGSSRTADVTDLRPVFSEITLDIEQIVNKIGVQEMNERFNKSLEYNVWLGGHQGPEMVLAAYKAFAGPDQLTVENLRQAQILGWCSELVKIHFVITDDMIDGGETRRRGQPAWYQQEDIGTAAISDSIMLHHSSFRVLKRHFRDHPLYTCFVEYLQDVVMKTALGQCLDVQSTRDGKPQLDLFTRDRYEAIIKYKTTFVLYLPVAFAILLARGDDVETQRKSEAIMMQICKWIQAQDDFLDYTAKPKLIGKDIDLDMKRGKCTWLAVTALERATPDQKGIMERYYGSVDPKHIQACRELYAQLNVSQLFLAYEKELLDQLRTQIRQHFSGKPREMFNKLIEKFHRDTTNWF